MGRPQEVPTIESAASQIEETLKLLNLNMVFIASDAPIEGIHKSL